MGFFINNQEFMVGKLYSVTRYSGSDKEIYYKKIRKELYERIIDYYYAVDRVKFYNEVIHFVGEWELENLVFNLFLEKDLENIINQITITKKFEYSFQSTFLQSLFEKYLVNKKNFKLLFFKLDLLRRSEIMNLSQDDWNSINTGRHPVINKFSIFFNNALKEGDKEHLYEAYLILVYAWSLYEVMHTPFNNIKAILLYDKLYNHILKNSEEEILRKNFVDFINSVDKLEKYCFVCNLSIFFPFTNNLDVKKYADGLKKQSKRLSDIYVSFSKQIDIKKMSFNELANDFILASADNLKVIKEEFVNRIDLENYPPVEVLKDIKDLEIIRKTYRFEKMRF